MKGIEILFPKSDRPGYIQGAVNLVNHYNKEGLMLPATFDKYQSLAEKGHLALATTTQAEVVGTVAYTWQYPMDIWELGGLPVKEGCLHKGIATVLIKELLKKVHHSKTIVVANKNSVPLFQKMGAKEIGFPNTLPDEIYEPCANCPVKPEQGCCDTLMSLAPIILSIVSGDMTPRQSDRLIWGIGENAQDHYKDLVIPAEDWGKQK